MKKLILIIIIISNIGCMDSDILYKDSNGIIKLKEDVVVEIGYVGRVDGDKYKLVDRDMLRQMIYEEEDVSFVCTSKITDMRRIFRGNKFDKQYGNGSKLHSSEFTVDISSWDVSNVTDMSDLGLDRIYNFNGDISNWDVSSVTGLLGFIVFNAFTRFRFSL